MGAYSTLPLEWLVGELDAMKGLWTEKPPEAYSLVRTRKS